MRAPKLDERLQTVADLVRPGSCVADVGCDHGKLAAYLACHGQPGVMAVDLRAEPLERARATCRRAGCEERVRFCLGDGLAELEPGCAQDIVLAGLSAESIQKILQAAPWVQTPGVRLILVPASRHSALRQYLCRQGFYLAADFPLQVGGYWYAVMAADYTAQPWEPDGLFCVLGRTGERPLGRDYAAWQRGKLAKIRCGLAPGAQRDGVDALLQQLAERGADDDGLA